MTPGRSDQNMTTKRVDARDALRKLRAPHGGFAMVALDQRESLRRMFPLVDGNEVGDDALRAFKHEATGILSQHASAVLLDRPYGLGDDPRWPLAPHCALIVAADELRQPPDMPVVDTALDPLVTPEYVRRVGASAIKLLVIWRDRSERHEAILRAAGELASYGGSIYKAEVPGYVPGDMSQVREHAAALTELIDIPWVVLSNGVERDDFADAVRESVLGGASGFLAGRAVWADTVAEPDPGAAMRTRSVGRLENLSRIVEEARA